MYTEAPFRYETRWHNKTVLHLTMHGVVDAVSVASMANEATQMIKNHALSAVIIDTSGVKTVNASLELMHTSKRLLNELKIAGASHVVGVSKQSTVRALASSLGFAVKLPMRLKSTLDEALASLVESGDKRS